MTKPEVEAFLTIIKCGSISVAADRLFVTQPALSRRIRSLEEELGYALFERGRGIRNIRLTEQGEDFVMVAERLLLLYAEAEEIPKKKRRPVLHVSTVNSLAAYLMPPVLRTMMEGPEACSVIFQSGRSQDIYGYVERGESDVALVSDLLHSNRAITFPVFREPFAFVGGSGWLKNDVDCGEDARSAISPEVLDPADQIRMPWNPEYDIWHRKRFPPDSMPGLTADKMEFLEEYLEGKTWAVAPLLVARRMKRKDILIRPLEKGPEDLTIYGLVTDSQKSRQVERFLQAVGAEVSKIPGIQLLI